jgi:hypothetical protein
MAKPGSSEYAAGFFSGQTSNFNSDLNYVLNRACGWADFLWRTLAPDTAVRNLRLGTETDPFTGTNPLYGNHVRYDSLAGKWYSIACDAASNGTIRCYDSDDGITWSDVTHLSITNTDSQNFGPIYTDGTYCAAAITSETGPTPSFWLSSDLTVANLTEVSTSIGSIEIVRDMLFDQDSGRWFVLGTNDPATTGYVYSSADGVTWTSETSSANNLTSFATDHTGRAVAIASDSGGLLYCTSGMTGSWNVGGTAGSSAMRMVRYLPNVNLFAMTDSANSIHLLHNGVSLSANPFDTDYDARLCIFSEDVNLFLGEGSTRSNSLEWYSIVSAQDRNLFNIRSLGYSAWNDAEPWSENMGFEGGAGKLPFSYEFGSSSDDRFGLMQYGPTGLT